MEDIVDNEPPIFSIPDPDLSREGRRLQMAWSGQSSLTVYSTAEPSHVSRPIAPTNFGLSGANFDTKLHQVRPRVTVFHDIVRKLVNEANGTFLSLQKMMEKSSFSDRGVDAPKVSKHYRAVIRACLDDLHDERNKTEDKEQKEELENLVNTFYCAECVWHACEILYIDSIPGDVVVPQLLEWVRIHFPNHEQTASHILEECEIGAEENSDYWNTVIGMIMQGRIDIARALLRLHSNNGTNQFMIADNILRSMPSYDTYNVLSMNEFKVNWKHWQVVCESKIDANTFKSTPNLEHIMRLVCGQRSAMEVARIDYTSWWELLGAWLLYVSPGSRRGDLGRIARECSSVRPSNNSTVTPTKLDNILLALMEDDMHQVLHDIQKINDNGWLATHLTDLLVHCGKMKLLDENQIDITGDLRDTLVLEYGSLLGSHHSLWPVGFSYLAQCPEKYHDVNAKEAMHRASIIVSCLPLRYEYRVMKILHIARKYNLYNIESLCQRQSILLAERGHGGAALSWALKARAAPLAAKLADNALKQYAKTGKLSDTDLLGSLGTDIMLSDRLVFLAKYSEFHKLYNEKEFKRAGSVIVSLLGSKITPNYFWLTLFMDTLPLLESSEIVFSADETLEIMHSMEEHISSTETYDKQELMRLALARNLSRTLLMDDIESIGRAHA